MSLCGRISVPTNIAIEEHSNLEYSYFWSFLISSSSQKLINLYLCCFLQLHREGPPVIGPNPLPELIHVGVALESCSYLDEDFFAYAVLNSLRGGGGSFSAGGPGKGMYTHLYQEVLSRHHWVYWAMAQNHAYVDSGIFCLFGSCHPSKV